MDDRCQTWPLRHSMVPIVWRVFQIYQKLIKFCNIKKTVPSQFEDTKVQQKQSGRNGMNYFFMGSSYKIQIPSALLFASFLSPRYTHSGFYIHICPTNFWPPFDFLKFKVPTLLYPPSISTFVRPPFDPLLIFKPEVPELGLLYPHLSHVI